MKRLLGGLAILALLSCGAGRARADLITYTWNDDFNNSGFGGSFTADTTKFANGPGNTKLLTASSVVSSSFFEDRFGGQFFPPGTGFMFQVSGVSPSNGIQVDPLTGAVLGSGSILFGASDVKTLSGKQYQIVSSIADFNTNFATSNGETWSYQYTEVGSGQNQPGFTGSNGHWEVSVTHTATPDPGGLVLLSAGTAVLLCHAWRRRRTAPAAA
jgi:hypothetical protein